MGTNSNGSHSGGNASTNTSNNELPFDRQLIASKLAAALVIHGREDISSDQMDSLIQMFLLMVKLNKNRLDREGKPVRIRDIAKELDLPIEMPTNKRGNEVHDKNEFTNMFPDDNVQHSNEHLEKDVANKSDNNVNNASSNMLESLTDSDLQTLLQNFKHLSNEEQHHLVVHLKKLENADPQRVEKLRKYVNLAELSNDNSQAKKNSNNNQADVTTINLNRNDNHSKHVEDSPPGTSHTHPSLYSDDEDMSASIGTRRHNPSQKINLTHDDDEDDDDYNFEEVFKAASTNNRARGSEERSHSRTETTNPTISKQEPIIPGSSSPSALTFKSSSFNVNLSDTQSLIANLMGSLQQSNAAGISTKTATTAPVGKTIPSIQNRQIQPNAQPANAQQAQANVVAPSVNMAQQPVIPTQQSMLAAQQQYYQQQAGFNNGYNQQNMAGYNYMAAGYANQTAANYNNPAFCQQWNNWQSYNMANTQQQGTQPAPGYNMYGQGGN